MYRAVVAYETALRQAREDYMEEQDRHGDALTDRARTLMAVEGKEVVGMTLLPNIDYVCTTALMSDGTTNHKHLTWKELM